VTTTYDPHDPVYLVESDLREEMVRVYDICHGCRLCFKFCTAFPTLFEYIDSFPSQDAAEMTPEQQDQVVEECFNCKLCYVNCPYTPGQGHEWNLDFPRLMLRAEAILVAKEKKLSRERISTEAVARTDLNGKLGTRLSGVVNRTISKPGSLPRRLMSKTAGIASERILPLFARERFSTWFRRRTPALGRDRQDTVALFPTCLVEYNQPAIGHDLVKVYEHNGVECELPEGMQCCGAPWLHSGELDKFVEQGRRNIAALAPHARRGHKIVVPQPTCSYVLKKDYVDYIGGADAEAVASATRDSSEYLMELRKGEGTELVEDFDGDVPEQVTYHVPCHLRAQEIGLKSRDLMKAAGIKARLVQECSAIDGMWGYKEENYERSKKVAAKMARGVDQAMKATGVRVVVGDCHLANGSIAEETGVVPMHPIQLVARAYGLPPEPGDGPGFVVGETTGSGD